MNLLMSTVLKNKIKDYNSINSAYTVEANI